MSDVEKGEVDESLPSEEEEEKEEETEETEEVEEEEVEEEQKPSDRAFANMRRENRRMKEQINILMQQVRGTQKPEKGEEDEFAADDESYLKAGDIKKLVDSRVRKMAPSQKPDKAVLEDMLNASEAIAMIRHSDYAEVVEDFREELDDDPSLQAFIVGTPGTHMNAGERMYQFALMRKGQGSGSRKQTIEAVVSHKKKPATMGAVSKKSPSSAFNFTGKTVDEIREFKKKNPDKYAEAVKKLEGGTA